jgi:hypothetical protein
MSRFYSAIQNGVVVRRGTFTNLDLLQIDFPVSQFELVLDEYLELATQEQDYQARRRMVYPPQADLADALYWQSKGDNSKLTAYLAAVDAVKELIPKI